MWFGFSALLMQVALPRDIQARHGHSVTVFGSEPNFRQLVMVGGQIKSGGFAATALLNLGEIIMLLPNCQWTAFPCEITSITCILGYKLMIHWGKLNGTIICIKNNVSRWYCIGNHGSTQTSRWWLCSTTSQSLCPSLSHQSSTHVVYNVNHQSKEHSRQNPGEPW